MVSRSKNALGIGLWFCLFASVLLFKSVLAVEDEDHFQEESSGDDEFKNVIDEEENPQVPGDSGDTAGEEIPAAKKSSSSPDAQLSFRFTSKSPEMANRELFANQPVKGAVHFWNRGFSSFTITEIEATFFNESDPTMCIHKFLLHSVESGVVKSGDHVDVEYSFTPSESFIGVGGLRLAIDVRYRDEEDCSFTNTLFNETLSVVKDDLAFLLDNRFHLILITVLGAFLIWLGQDYFTAWYFDDEQNKAADAAHGAVGSKVEGGAKNKDEDVDFDWLPESGLPYERKKGEAKKPHKKRPVKAH